MLRRRKGQSTAEYAIVIGLVIAAAVAMQVYVKRGIQGRIRDAVNYTDPDVLSQPIRYGADTALTQYEVQYQGETDVKTIRDVEKDETALTGGGVSRSTAKENVSRTKGGTQTIYAP